MAQVFRKIADLENYSYGRMADAMEEVYNKLLDHLLEIIKRDVYGAWKPKFYVRAGDLLKRENWEIKINRGRGKYRGRLYGQIYFKGEALTRPHGFGEGTALNAPSKFIHGNPVEDFEPVNFLKNVK